jgi:hypothetical protein
MIIWINEVLPYDPEFVGYILVKWVPVPDLTAAAAETGAK